MSQQDQIMERLAALRDALAEHSLFPEDSFAWGAACLTQFLEQRGELSMEQAFGLVERKIPMGERVTSEVLRMKWNKPGMSWREVCDELARKGLDANERNVRRYWREFEEKVRVCVVPEEVTKRLDERERTGNGNGNG